MVWKMLTAFVIVCVVVLVVALVRVAFKCDYEVLECTSWCTFSYPAYRV